MKRAFFAALALLSASIAVAEEGKPVVGVKTPYAAGTFYPSNPVELGGMIDDYLLMAPAPDPLRESAGRLTALVVPHAGYVFSGRIAAAAYRRLKGHSYDTVVLIGPYHASYFKGASVWPSGSWRTPLGDVPVDEETAAAIRAESPAFAYDASVHLAEHSLETQVPFLQRTLKNFKIVPIVLNDASSKNVEALAEAVKKNTAGKNVLIVVSTDLTHYRPEAQAQARDKLTLGLIEKRARLNLAMALEDGEAELCGHAAVLTYLAFEEKNRMNASRLETVAYATSARATGRSESVVGYGAMAAYVDVAPLPEKAASASASPQASAETAVYTPEQERELLKIARRAVEDAVRGFDPPSPSNYDPKLDEPRAVFVTLKRKEALRGCIGRMTPADPLYKAVQKTARLSATQDTRFKPVRPEELPEIRIEISILGQMRKIAGAQELVYGTQGVVLKKDGRTGVFLPSVIRETGWGKEQFLGELCSEKMGLPSNCWRDPSVEFSVFDTHEFSE